MIDKKSQPTKNKEIFASIENIDFEKANLLINEVDLYLNSSNKQILKKILSNELIKYKKQ